MLTLSDPLTVSGEWWKAGEQARQVAGTLTWSDQRGRLALQAALTPLRGNIFAGESSEYSALHGVTTQSKLVTLLKAHTYGTPIHFNEGRVCELENVFTSWIVFGAHVIEGTLFTQIEARIPGLAIWLGNQGALQSMARPTPDSPGSIHYEFKILAEEEFSIAALPGNIGFRVRHEHHGELESGFSISASGYLRIAPSSPQSVEWLVDRLTRVTSLLAFVADAPMAPDQLSLQMDEESKSVDLLVALNRATRCGFTRAHEFFMVRNQMGVELSAVLSRWFEAYESIANPSQLGLSVLHSEKLWLHVEFLSFMQAFEGFHRAVVGGNYMSETSYKPFRDEMYKHIPTQLADGHRAALKSKIKYGYEFSLQKRLDQLVERLTMPLRKHVLFDDGDFPRSWIDTRNYYTHSDAAGETQALDGVEMHQANVRMRHLLRALYLEFVGIPSEAILRALLNQLCDECAYLVQLNAVIHRKKNPGSTAGLVMSVKTSKKPS